MQFINYFDDFRLIEQELIVAANIYSGDKTGEVWKSDDDLELAFIALALFENWQRVAQLAAMPRMVAISSYQVCLRIAAEFRALSASDLTEVADVKMSEIIERLAKQNEITPSPELTGLAQTLFEYACPKDPLIPHAMKFQCDAIIVGAWTAFEALASDLWIHAVNKRPNSLGGKLVAAKAQDEAKDKYTPKQVSLDTLRQYGFNLQDHMGDVLYDKFKFKSLDNIRDAYREAFTRASNICKTIAHEDLSALFQARNAIVHRGGKVDQMFEKRMKSHPELSAFKRGDTLTLPGKLVARLVLESYNTTTNLLLAVRDWLQANPD